jgi:hypothetical protein
MTCFRQPFDREDTMATTLSPLATRLLLGGWLCQLLLSAVIASEILRDQGYNTYAVGKWHLTNEYPRGSIFSGVVGRTRDVSSPAWPRPPRCRGGCGRLLSSQAPLGLLPASWRGDLPAASGTTRWQGDLAADGSFQLRQILLNRPAPNRFDDIGRWRLERGTQRLVLKGGREAPVFFQPVNGGAQLRKLSLDVDALEQVRRWSIDRSNLLLQDERGRTLLLFTTKS